MSIRRAARPQSNFYLLEKSISEDDRLSWGARGLLIFLLGKPDHWQVSTAHLVKQTVDSAKPSKRDAVRSLLSELIDAGYVTRQRVRDEAGGFNGMEYLVSEKPLPQTDHPGTDNPAPVEPSPPNPPLVSTEVLVSTETAANNNVHNAFELFWSAGMAKINKKKAFAIFKRIAGKEPMAFAQRLQADIQARLRAEQMGFDAMHPTTYLNGERWNDEIKQGTAAKPNARLSPLEQYEADLRERDAQRAASGMAMGQDDRDLWGDMAEGARQDAYIDLDAGDWETRGE